MATIVANASKQIDEAFDKFTGFQYEMCVHLRELIHKVLPEVKEDWKWGPNFNVSGMVCGVWGFKNHVKLVFFKGSMMKDKYKLFNQGDMNTGNRSINFCEGDKIDDKKIGEYLKEAAEINKKGIRPMKKEIKVVVPVELARALAKNKKLKTYFDKLAPSHRRDYSDYVSEAKLKETRDKRVLKVMDMLKKNMTLNQKYMK